MEHTRNPFNRETRQERIVVPLLVPIMCILYFNLTFSNEGQNNSQEYIPQNVYQPPINPQLKHLQDSVRLEVNSDINEIKLFFSKDKSGWNIFGEKIEDFLKMVSDEPKKLRYADSKNGYLISPDNNGKFQVFKVADTNPLQDYVYNGDNNGKTTKIGDFTLKQDGLGTRNVEIHSKHGWQSETKGTSADGTYEEIVKVSSSL